MKATTALKKISQLKKRIWIIRGGQGAAKTISLLIILINHASSNPDKEIIIGSEELSKMRLTIIKDFKKVMKSFGIYKREYFLADVLYRFPNGSFIQFVGLDKEDIGKGLRSDVFYLNEANKTTFEKCREILSRAKRVMLDYNPNIRFWVDEHLIPREDAEELVLTYKDNEFLSKEEVYEIENYKKLGFKNPDLKNYDFEENIKSPYWANKWRVYGLGQYGQIEGAVYTDWKIGEFDNLLPYRFGLDFGFSNDPDALVKIAVDEKKKLIYLHECFYNSGQSFEVLKSTLSFHVTRKDRIIADSAEDRLIDDLKKFFNIIEAKKWKVIERIKKMQGYTLIVTKESINLQSELISYIWSDKKSETPVDKNNHLLDAAGYALTGERHGNKISALGFRN